MTRSSLGDMLPSGDHLLALMNDVGDTERIVEELQQTVPVAAVPA